MVVLPPFADDVPMLPVVPLAPLPCVPDGSPLVPSVPAVKPDDALVAAQAPQGGGGEEEGTRGQAKQLSSGLLHGDQTRRRATGTTWEVRYSLDG